MGDRDSVRGRQVEKSSYRPGLRASWKVTGLHVSTNKWSGLRFLILCGGSQSLLDTRWPKKRVEKRSKTETTLQSQEGERVYANPMQPPDAPSGY
jgi:hypothetical protein